MDGTRALCAAASAAATPAIAAPATELPARNYSDEWARRKDAVNKAKREANAANKEKREAAQHKDATRWADKKTRDQG